MPPMTARAPYPLRVMAPDDWDAFVLVAEHAFGEVVPPESAAFLRSVLPAERVLLATDGAAVVGQAGAYRLRMTVPGGALREVAGVTWVAVLPTHRRRGILRRLMAELMEGMHGRGESIAALWASEPAIYGRFGFGLATRQVDLRLRRGAALIAPPDASHLLRLAAPADVLAATEALYAAELPERPGMIAHEPEWGGRPLEEVAREGAGPLRAVLAERAGEARGYARYAVRPAGGEPGATVHVEAVHGRDPAARAALWGYLLDLDLSELVVAPGRPVDDPLLDMLVDPGAADPRIGDALHLRLIDAAAALSARAYSAPVDVVIDLRDGDCPWNARRLRLSGDATGATCAPTTAAADLSMSAQEIGAAYLGGTSLRTLAAAGRVEELRRGAVAAAARAFAHDPAPWCPMSF